MIAIDSSVIIAWINGLDDLPEVAKLERLIRQDQACVAPVTITEILSSAAVGSREIDAAAMLPRLPVTAGYWERAGQLRASVRRLRRKAAMADTLIAQACIDADVALLTRDADFQVFAEVGGLKLA